MHKRGGLKRVAGPFVPHATDREPVQFVVEQWKKPPGCLVVTRGGAQPPFQLIRGRIFGHLCTPSATGHGLFDARQSQASPGNSMGSVPDRVAGAPRFAAIGG
jgi:hypothetical protein